MQAPVPGNRQQLRRAVRLPGIERVQLPKRRDKHLVGVARGALQDSKSTEHKVVQSPASHWGKPSGEISKRSLGRLHPDQSISLAFQTGFLGEFVQKTIAICRGNHDGLEDPRSKLHM